MGDGADMALSETLDAEDERFLFRSGGMSDLEAFDRGHIDELGRYNDPPMFPKRARTYACKYCGARGLRWVETQLGWRLADESGARHVCAEYEQSRRPA